MKPVEQTILTVPGGNCFAASVASILELPLDALPVIEQHEDGQWFYQWLDWLGPLNLTFVLIASSPSWTPLGYAILSAQSPRDLCLHCVVCFNGKIAWDPSPWREQGVGEWRDWIIFQVLDPSKPVGSLP